MFLAILISYILGLILAAYSASYLWFACSIILLYFFLDFFKLKNKYFTLLFLVFLLSMANLYARNSILSDKRRLLQELPSQTLIAKVITKAKHDRFYNSSFVVEPELDRSWFSKQLLPIRLVLQTKTAKGFDYGDLLTSFQNLSKFQLRSFKRHKAFYKLKAKEIHYLGYSPNFLDDIQSGIKSYYYQRLSHLDATIVTSLLMGSRVIELPNDFLKQIRSLGIGHFFAASGFHVMLLSLFLLWLARFLSLSSNMAVFFTCLILFIYMGLAGFSPSIIRAVILFIAYAALKVFNRKAKPVTLLLFIAAVSLLLDPFVIYDLGFQFSYLAVLAILLWSSKIKSFVDFMPAYFSELIAVTLAVQVFLFPLLTLYFHKLQPWSLLANLIFAPIVSFLLLLSFLGMTFLLKPCLYLFKYILSLLASLPLLNLSLWLDLSSVLIIVLLLVFILIGAKSTKLYQSIMLMSLLLLMFVNIASPVKSIINGSIYHPKNYNFSKFTLGPLAYYQNPKLTLLHIYDVSRVAKLKHLKQVDVLLLPNLKARDKNLEKILAITKPKFTIAKFKRTSKQTRKNLKLIRQKSRLLKANEAILIKNDKLLILNQIS